MSTTEPYFADDRVIIPESVKRMSKEELEQEIVRLEEEAKKEKLNRKQKEVAAV